MINYLKNPTTINIIFINLNFGKNQRLTKIIKTVILRLMMGL
jgi:hypothetical protein